MAVSVPLLLAAALLLPAAHAGGARGYAYYDYGGDGTGFYSYGYDGYADSWGFDASDASVHPACQPDAASKDPSQLYVCDVRIEGADELLLGGLNGGIDGVYAYTECFGGKPMFVRKGSPEGQERCLWFRCACGRLACACLWG